MSKGSEMRLGPYPAVCYICGQRVVLTGLRALWFHTDEHGMRRSAHADCELKR